jgi:hypothetical protein
VVHSIEHFILNLGWTTSRVADGVAAWRAARGAARGAARWAARGAASGAARGWKFVFVSFDSFSKYIIYNVEEMLEHAISTIRSMKQIEVRQSRTENIALRNQWMQAKNITNYQTEYDRIRNHLQHSTTPATTRDQISKRKKTLEDFIG